MKPLFALLFLALGLAWPAPAQAGPEANKALFDRTVDKINFQTMEGVYDARFVRKKFPVNLMTRAERRDFKEFAGDDAFDKLFHNYNDEAEKYKNRFGPGHGATTLPVFTKALRSILIDANFEFFIRVLRRDDKQALVKRLEGTIKDAVTQYDASGEPQAENRLPDTISGATETATDESGGALPADEAVAAEEQVDAMNQAVTPGATDPSPDPMNAPKNGSGAGWGSSLALVLALAAVAGVAYLLFVVVPGLRTPSGAGYAEEEPHERAPLVDDHLPVTYAAEAQQRAFDLRFGLLADEVDELKGRVEELESRLADLLTAPADTRSALDYAPDHAPVTVVHAGADYLSLNENAPEAYDEAPERGGRA